jgi:hypothetical protein
VHIPETQVLGEVWSGQGAPVPSQKVAAYSMPLAQRPGRHSVWFG